MAKRRPKLKAGHSFECRQHLVGWWWWWFVALLATATTTLLSNQQVDCTFIRRTAAINAQPHQSLEHEAADVDPMEPCYLANNRASESLTISESTPIGTVVGEIMVNGDSSEDGNIELSIRMPGGQSSPPAALQSGGSNQASRRWVGAQQQAKTNYYSSTQQQQQQTSLSQRIGGGSSSSTPAPLQLVNGTTSSDGKSAAANNKSSPTPKTARDLSNLIDLMPPLSIEQGTKRLILAKKLDRENLDKYIQAGGGQASSMSSLSTLGSSASLTVHIKCQLRHSAQKRRGTSGGDEPSLTWNNSSSQATNKTGTSTTKPSRSQSSSSIIIPVHLIVTDENDNWPTFLGAPYIIDLNESSPIGSLLQNNEIVAYDTDQQGPLSTIEYSLVGGNYWADSFAFLNPLDSRSLVVKSNQLLDYESQPKLALKVMASDQGEPPNWAITTLFVNLLDQDDLNPVFNEDKFQAFVRENRPGELIELAPKRLVARDGDRTLNAPIVYSFHRKTSQSIHFELDPELAGKLTLKKTLPAIDRPFCLLVRATQVDNPRRWSLAMINIQPPSLPLISTTTASNSTTAEESSVDFRFPQSRYTVEMSEAAAVGSTVLLLKVADQRLDGVTYQLLDNELGYLSLDEHSGRLTLNRSLDFEMHPQISVRILASYELFQDQTSSQLPTLLCDTARVSLNVLDFNEFTPEFSHEQYNFQLSVSELIANFEPQRKDEGEDQEEDEEQLATDSARRRKSQVEFARRFGASSGGDWHDHHSQLADLNPLMVTEDFGYKALRLGQVFCADRDSSDKLGLQLTGPRANMFYLAQDGQLYLPLVNLTSSADSDMMSSRRSDSAAADAPTLINNQFVLSRLFAKSATTMRESNRRSSSNEPNYSQLDRTYLNYLLGEFNNLGRLKLKVLARDDGQPESRQSTALVVISIISIENFILQRAPPPVLGGATEPATAEPMRSNETASRESSAKQQLMMIHSTNGRSFVQVNSDIITNLLSPSSKQRQQDDSPTRLKDQHQTTPTFGANKLESLELATSSTTINQNAILSANGTQATSVASSQNLHHQEQPFKPPSLLLIDDDGAKFVAMPAAVEVYNQQVREAAAQQSRYASSKSSANTKQTDSSWLNWLASQPAGSTLTQLVVIAAVLIVGLATRFKSTLFTGERNHLSEAYSHHQDHSGLSTTTSGGRFNDDNHACWTRKWPRFSLSSQSSDSFNHHHRVAGSTPPSGSSPLHDHSPSSSSSSNSSSSTARYNNSDSANRKSQRRTRGGGEITMIGSNSRSDTKQQNLFNHLKSTIGKMLEMRHESGDQSHLSSGISQVTVKPLDCEIYENHQHRQQRDISTSSSGGASFADQVAATTGSSPDVVASKIASSSSSPSPLSTFLGTTTSQTNKSAREGEPERCSQPSSCNKTIVSINITSPPSETSHTKPAAPTMLQQKLHNCSKPQSSSSSVISLVSMSSSISNKISAAVERSATATANAPRKMATTTISSSSTSDVSSIDSTTLFNGLAASSRVVNRQASCDVQQHQPRHGAMPPKPPPLPPPPPSLIQVRFEGTKPENANVEANSVKSSSSSNRSQLGHSVPAIKKQSDVNNTTQTNQLYSKQQEQRREFPQNPAHVKLRQEALAEKVMNSSGQQQQTTSTGKQQQRAQPVVSTGRLFDRKHGNVSSLAASNKTAVTATISSSTGGRREARQQLERTLPSLVLAPPTPPPMPPSSRSNNQKSSTGHHQFKASHSSSSLSATAKTVSPTTSVDRGYESFQSYINTAAPSSQSQQQRQNTHSFSSLHEYEDHHQEQQLHYDTMLNGYENDSALVDEEGDFFYCCNSNKKERGGAKTRSSHDRNQVGAGRNPLIVGKLLSDYASHTYEQQQQLDEDAEFQHRSMRQQQQQRKSSVQDRLHKTSHPPQHSRASSSTRANQNHHDLNQKSFVPSSSSHMYSYQLNEQQAAAQNQNRRINSLARHGDGAGKPATTNTSRHHHHHHHPHHTSTSNNNNKKQLTWSDQVETTNY